MNAKARNTPAIHIADCIYFISKNSHAENLNLGSPGNFSYGLIDLPTARRFPDGELVITHSYRSLARSAISFQALPRVGFAFRYIGMVLEERLTEGSIMIGALMLIFRF